MNRRAVALFGIALASCSASPSTPSQVTPIADAAPPILSNVPAPELGKGDHTAGSVVLTEIATSDNELNGPRDLAFNPLRPDELWIVNNGDNSVVIVHDASTGARTSEQRKDGDAVHFMPFPSSIVFGQDTTSFGIPGTFGTCGESRDNYGGRQKSDDFMGPVLWSSDLSVFAMSNLNGLGSHLDMLHNTPLCMGIAHESANRYWVFGGLNNSLDLYDFKQDNGIGNDDHSDGESYQYVAGKMKYVSGVPSHVFFRDEDAMLYVADSGNARVAKLDTKSGKRGLPIVTKEPMALAVVMDGATLTDVVPAGAGLLEVPSGLEIHNTFIYVSDNANSRISAFSLDGERVNYLDTGLPAGSLAGMNFGGDGKLYLVDMIGNRVLRIDPKP